jgi:mono/diheme cytochrome c family protein
VTPKIFSKRNLGALALLAVSGLLVFWVASAPHPYVAADIPPHTANLENGKLLYNIGGCVSCHASEADAAVPAGGKPLTTPDGAHMIPAFPYTSYAHMNFEDVLDIKAYLDSLPPIKTATKPHEVIALPIIRRGLGLWKWIGLDDAKFIADAKQSVSWNRGAYLVSGPGHCSECHTPRTMFMSSDISKMFQGGPHPDGKGKVPSLRDLAL